MINTVQQFYDSLAPDYHLIFADWDQSIERHGTALDRLIRAHTWDSTPATLLDCSCGIGTQAIGLAKRSYRVHATDLSPVSVARAMQEAARHGVTLETSVADFRALEDHVEGMFDIVLSGGNAIPHLLTDADLLAAARSMYARLNAGGLLLISIRDYDYFRQNPPRATTPVVIDPGGNKTGNRRIIFQVWDWADDFSTYDVTLFIVQATGESYQLTHHATTYRALLRSELSAILEQAGFQEIRWHMPQDTGYFQPVVTARPK